VRPAGFAGQGARESRVRPIRAALGRDVRPLPADQQPSTSLSASRVANQHDAGRSRRARLNAATNAGSIATSAAPLPRAADSTAPIS
jgi:hypothetical protein